MESYQPRYVYWELSNYCNLRCKHCFAEAVGDKSTIANEWHIRSKLQEMRRRGRFAVRFGGGEPLMVPYIYNLVEFCNFNDIPVDITTNGTLLTEESLIMLSQAGLRELTISLDGLEATHDFIRGSGMFQHSLEAIKRGLLCSNITLSIAFTVTALNYGQLETFTEKLVNIGVTKFYFFRYCANSNSNYLELNQSVLEYVSKSINQLIQKYNNITFVHEGFGFYTKRWDKRYPVTEGCNFLKGVLSIDYRGNIVVCAAINKILGNIFGDELATLYDKVRDEQKAIACVPIECKPCCYSKVCHGGCKSCSYLTNGSYQLKDIYCFT